VSSALACARVVHSMSQTRTCARAKGFVSGELAEHVQLRVTPVSRCTSATLTSTTFYGPANQLKAPLRPSLESAQPSRSAARSDWLRLTPCVQSVHVETRTKIAMAEALNGPYRAEIIRNRGPSR